MILANAPHTIGSTTGSWASKANMPRGRMDMAAAAWDDKIYVIGGSNESNSLDWLDIYDCAADTWTTGTPMPAPKRNPGAATVGNGIYVLGDDQRLFVYDPETSMWSEKAQLPVNASGGNEGNFGIAAVNGRIYAAKGSRNYPLGDYWTYCYDPVADTWTEKTGISYHRSIQSLASLNGRLYAIGGADPSLGGRVEVSRVDIYTPANDSWQLDAIPRMSTVRTHLEPETEVVNGKIYVVGGWDGYNALGSVEEYDPASNSWKYMASMTTSRYALATATAEGRIYAIGGNWGGSGGHLQTVNEAFSPPETALVGYWEFDEGSGTIAHDSSGNGNNGVIHTATWTDGIVGKALHFNGVDSWVEVPNSPTLTNLSQITVEAWIQEDSITAQLKGIVSKCDGKAPPTNAEYFLGTTENGKVFFETDRGTAIFSVQTTPLITEAGRWYHVAGTWSGDTYTIYVDGAPVLSGNCTPQTTLSNNLPVQIGRHGAESWVYFQGIIDNVKIYNCVRTAQQILADSNFGNVTSSISYAWNQQIPSVNNIVTFSSNLAWNSSSVWSYSWDFGDGNTTQTAYSWIAHRYAPAGNYSVTLTTQFSDNTTARSTLSLMVYGLPNAYFSCSNTNPYEGETIYFDTSGSSFPNDLYGNSRFTIDYGDGYGQHQYYSFTSIPYTYYAAGTYVANLTLVDSKGISDSYSQSIVVKPQPWINKIPWNYVSPLSALLMCLGAGLSYKRRRGLGPRLIGKADKKSVEGKLGEAAECYARASTLYCKKENELKGSMSLYLKTAKRAVCQAALKGDEKTLEVIDKAQERLADKQQIEKGYEEQLNVVDAMLEDAKNGKLDFAVDSVLDDRFVQKFQSMFDKTDEIEVASLAGMMGYDENIARMILSKGIGKGIFNVVLTEDGKKVLSKRRLKDILRGKLKSA